MVLADSSGISVILLFAFCYSCLVALCLSVMAQVSISMSVLIINTMINEEIKARKNLSKLTISVV